MTPAILTWNEDGQPRQALWRDERGAAPPVRVEVVDDRLRADDAFQLVCGGTALLWRGDYHNARQMLTALARRLTVRENRRAARPRKTVADGPAAIFHRHRLAQAQRAQTLSLLLVPCEAGYRLTLRTTRDLGRLDLNGPAALDSAVPDWRDRQTWACGLQHVVDHHLEAASALQGFELRVCLVHELPNCSAIRVWSVWKS